MACEGIVARNNVAVFADISVTIAALAPASLRLFATLINPLGPRAQCRGPAFLGIFMTTVQTFSASVNESAFLKKMGLLFAGSDSFLSEALQNARRAEASEIKVKIEEHRLQIIDNGNGITDFGKLFVFCESGWAQKVQATDNPYGMGVFSYFFAADKVTFESQGRKVVVNSEAFMCGGTAEEETSDVMTGTVITFEGLKVESQVLVEALPRFAMGFPIPVFSWTKAKPAEESAEIDYEWKELPRPHALTSGFCSTAVGMVKTDLTTVTHIYLQGLPIKVDSRCGNVVHLDSTQFQAVMPDRKSLYDSEVQEVRIQKAIRALQIEQIKEAKASMTARAFVESYFWFLHGSPDITLLDDVNYLCSRMLNCVQPDVKEPDAGFFGSLTKETISQRVLVKNLPEMTDHAYSALMHCVMSEADWVVLKSVSETHWASAEAVDFESLKFSIITTGECRLGNVNGITVKVYDTVSVRVYNEDGFDITVPMNTFLLNPEDPESEYVELDTDMEVLTPRGCMHTPECALSDYVYGDHSEREDDAQRDEDARTWLATLQKLNGSCNFFKNLESALQQAPKVVSQASNEMALVISDDSYRGTKCIKIDDDWFAKMAKESGADAEKLKQAFIETTKA